MMNARPSSTTKKAPFEALMGYIPAVHQHTSVTRFQNTSDQLEAIKLIRREAQSHMTHAQELLTKINQFQPYTLGQKVWLKATNLKMSHPMVKLQAKHYGPFSITNVISHVAYQLDLPPQWKIHNVFHTGYLSPYKEMEEHSPNFPEPPPELVEGEPEYKIECIVNMRRFGHNKKLQYKVRWKGYAEAHDSWEPLENIHAPELLKEYHRESWTTIRHICINTQPPYDKKTLTPTPIFTSTPSKTFHLSLAMTNVEQDYEEQHISKEQQYCVLTHDMPHCLAYLSHRDQEALRLDQFGNNPTPTQVDTFIRHMGLNPSSMSIRQQIQARLDDNAPPFEFIADHPTLYRSPSPDPIPIPPCLNEISPTCSKIGSELWEQTHFPKGLAFLRTQSPSNPALDRPLSATTLLSYLTESDNNPLAKFPHTSTFNTPYITPEPSEHTDWGEEIAVEDIGAPNEDLRQFSTHLGAHWVIYNPCIHSNYILIPAGPEGNAIFAPA